MGRHMFLALIWPGLLQWVLEASTPMHLLQKAANVNQLAVTASDMSSRRSELHRAMKFVQDMALKESDTPKHNTSMTTTESAALATIKQFIYKLIGDMDLSHGEDQQEVNQSTQFVQNCVDDANSSLRNIVVPANISANTSRWVHHDCRVRECADDIVVGTNCTDYDTHRKSSPPPDCMSTDLSAQMIKTSDASEKVTMEACLALTWEWIDPLYWFYYYCKNSRNVHDQTRIECDGNQDTFEADYCYYSEKLTDTCADQTRCMNRTIRSRNETYPAVNVSANARASDFETGLRILCFFGVWEEENNTKKKNVYQACVDLELNQTSKERFIIDFPGLPDAYPCEVEEGNPDDLSWETEEYKDKSWYHCAATKTLTKCPFLTTTTTTTTTPTTTTTTTTTTTARVGFSLAGRGQSCDAACSSQGMSCSDDDNAKNMHRLDSKAKFNNMYRTLTGSSCAMYVTTAHTQSGVPFVEHHHKGSKCWLPRSSTTPSCSVTRGSNSRMCWCSTPTTTCNFDAYTGKTDAFPDGYVVTGAGSAEWNGCYRRIDYDANSYPLASDPLYQKSSAYEIYNISGNWRLANYGIDMGYQATEKSDLPDNALWKLVNGRAPLPHVEPVYV